MNQRPKIKIELTTTDKIIELIGWFALFAIWVLTIVSYSKLPETIPTHYNGAGEVDRFGKKINILILPLLATFFFVGISVLNKFPHIFSYPKKIDKDNALEHYTNLTRMNRYIKLFFVIIFGMLAFKTINISGGLDVWFLTTAIGLFFIFLIYFIVKQSKNKPPQTIEY